MRFFTTNAHLRSLVHLISNQIEFNCGNACTFMIQIFQYSHDFALNSFQLLADAVLLINANILGAFCYGISDKQQRTAFLGTRQCLEMKLVIEEQSAEQVK